MRVINTLRLGLASAALCGACVEPDPGMNQPSETGETGETGGEEGNPDPLGLADCPPFDPSEPTPLPAASWADLGEDHELMCALRALDAVVADRRILCLAENSHGVSQSYLWHALVLRYLVHVHGVRTVAFEATRARASLWTAYMNSGDLDSLEASFDLRPSLATSVEAAWLVDALADTAAILPEGERLTLTGYDVAVQPQIVRAAVLDYLDEAAPEQSETWAAMLPTLDDADMGGIDWLAASDAAGTLLDQLEANADAHLERVSAERHADARLDAEALRDGYAFRHYFEMGDFLGGNASFREPSMVRNVERLRDNIPADELLVIVGHNRHCARDWIAGYDLEGEPSPALGTALAEDLGEDYAILAQAYAGGSLTSVSMGAFQTSPFEAAAPLLEGVIADSTSEDALLIGELPEGSWALWQQSEIVVRDQFDWLLWLREVEGTASAL